MSKIIPFILLFLFITSYSSTACSNNNEYTHECLFIGFIKNHKFGIQNDVSTLELEFIYTLAFYYKNGNLTHTRIEKFPYGTIIFYRSAIIRGYIGTFFIFAKISCNIWYIESK